ncbi:MAG: hypothetical protein KME17_18760 [Cyanosarcina radialis HA8281-LM2]|jgi:hypothetical protein|nr:hypothetical protein [Cyanosarcina radialis HA8281-LM2]
MLWDKLEFIALIISICIEGVFVTIWAKFFGIDGKLLVIISIAATLITHPIAWKLFLDLSPYLNFPVRSLLLESAVILVEGLIYKIATSYSWRASISLSFGANLASYSCGLLWYQLLG